MSSAKSKAAALLGTAGGKAGKGEKKRRGDSAHYRKLVQMREAKRSKLNLCDKCGKRGLGAVKIQVEREGRYAVTIPVQHCRYCGHTQRVQS